MFSWLLCFAVQELVVAVCGVGRAKPGSSAGASAGPPQSYARALALPTGSFRGVFPPRDLAHHHSSSSMLLFCFLTFVQFLFLFLVSFGFLSVLFVCCTSPPLGLLHEPRGSVRAYM